MKIDAVLKYSSPRRKIKNRRYIKEAPTYGAEYIREKALDVLAGDIAPLLMSLVLDSATCMSVEALATVEDSEALARKLAQINSTYSTIF